MNINHVSRDADGNGHSDEVSDGTEKHVIGNRRKGAPCYKIVKNLADLCSCCSVFWKVDLVSSEIGYLAEENPKHRVEGVAGFLLTAYYKMLEERNDLKMELLSEEEP